jgi:oligopeptidase A
MYDKSYIKNQFFDSYKWSETYAADAYAAFEEAKFKGGESSVIEMGQLYRDTILSLGGGTAPQQVWEQFRGRSSVDIDALLRHSGLC